MNEFKAGFFMNPTELQRHRLAVTEQQLTEYWYSKSLLELEKILTIKDQYLIYEIIYLRYLAHYLNHKKIAPGQYFYVMHKEQALTEIYDAKIFRNPLYDKYQNDLISTFLIARRLNEEVPDDDVFEFLDYGIIEPLQWVLKVKESAILRIFPYLVHRFLQKKESSFDPSLRNPIGGYYLSKNPTMYREVVILDPKVYYYYIYSLLPKYELNIEASLKWLIQIIADLMYNNLLISWYESLTEEEKYQRHYKKYFRLIEKPKNKEEFTSIDNKFTEIKWQSFKIFVFKLKYKVKENEDNYECYQIDLKSEEQLNQPYEGLSIDDENILKAFEKQKISSPNYNEQYTTFFDNPQV